MLHSTPIHQYLNPIPLKHLEPDDTKPIQYIPMARCNSPVLSTCPLHTNSGCGKERGIVIGPWRPAKAAPVTGTTLRTSGPAPAVSRQ